MAHRKFTVSLALAGILFAAGLAAASIVEIRHFTVPSAMSVPITYTMDAVGDFVLPDDKGAYTITVVLTDTMPSDVPVTMTWVPDWDSAVVITSTLTGDTSFSTVISGTAPSVLTYTVVHLDVDNINEDFIVEFTHTWIPEPASALLFMGGAGIVFLARKRLRRG